MNEGTPPSPDAVRTVASPERRSVATDLLVALGLAALTLVVFAPVTTFEFLTIDDGSYVYANRNVRRGLSWEGTVWAFTRSYSSNWHPLTWLSHMLDVELFRMDAGAHHRTNVVLHALAAVLLFAALRTARLGRGAALFVAALFACHPLRAESVAWVAERKDVLSGVFFAATLWSHASYARAPSRVGYARTLACFTLGLLAKPMLVTLPAVLVLFDLWPLQRLRGQDGTQRPSAPPERTFRQLVLEKLPLLALAVGSSIVTFVVQSKSGAVRSLIQLSLEARLSNAITSVWAYVGKLFWPDPLSTFYPHPAIVTPHAFAPWRLSVWLGLAAIVAISVAALRSWRRRPWLTSGWFWYLGMLVPVIGILQVGEQAFADRYTYLPTIGLALLFVGGLQHLLAAPAVRLGALALGAAILGLSAWRTRLALEPWRNTETLFRHALAVTDHNYVAHYNLGVTLQARGELDAARSAFERTLAIKPDSSDACYNLGSIALEERRFAPAAKHFEEALRRHPTRVQAHVNLGWALAELDRLDEAEAALRRALELQPRSVEAWINLGGVAAKRNDFAAAARSFAKALEHDPERLAARYQLGVALARSGRDGEARVELERVLAREPSHVGARRALQALEPSRGGS